MNKRILHVEKYQRYHLLKGVFEMKEKFSEIMSWLKKPALTVHSENGCTITVIGIVIIFTIIAFHIMMCKMHSFCTKCKVKKAKENTSCQCE